jgi:hypothetical protein
MLCRRIGEVMMAKIRISEIFGGLPGELVPVSTNIEYEGNYAAWPWPRSMTERDLAPYQSAFPSAVITSGVLIGEKVILHGQMEVPEGIQTPDEAKKHIIERLNSVRA